MVAVKTKGRSARKCENNECFSSADDLNAKSGKVLSQSRLRASAESLGRNSETRILGKIVKSLVERQEACAHCKLRAIRCGKMSIFFTIGATRDLRLIKRALIFESALYHFFWVRRLCSGCVLRVKKIIAVLAKYQNSFFDFEEPTAITLPRIMRPSTGASRRLTLSPLVMKKNPFLQRISQSLCKIKEAFLLTRRISPILSSASGHLTISMTLFGGIRGSML